MNFSESVEYLYLLGNEVEAMKLGLENTEVLLDALGNPQQNYLKVQVAGTNGKGSVCAFLDSICRAAKINVGLYTSPHLISITERVRVNGEDISEDSFGKLATGIRATAEKLLAEGRLQYTPTFFEQMTAMALVAFAEAKVELAVLETGLGGRLDAVTAAKAEIAAITRIDFDHQEYLGETIEEIAAEKAAIIRSDTKAMVFGNQFPDALAAIEERWRNTGGNTPGRTRVQVGTDAAGTHSLPLVFPPSSLGLKGAHQSENAQIAVGVARELAAYLSISDAEIGIGLAAARHPGRLEYIGNVLLDGAHNVGGALALAAYIDEFERRPITLIFGAMADKDVRGMTHLLFPLASKVILSRPDNSRAMTTADLFAQTPDGFDSDRIELVDSLGDAIKRARAVSSDNDLILIAGSLYLVGEARQILMG